MTRPAHWEAPWLFSTTATAASDVGTYNVTASGLSTANYAITDITGSLSISPAAQTITWSTPADITYGTPLGATQLNAAVTGTGPAPAGTLTYSPAAGTVLSAGVGQTLTVVAAATLDYNQATASVLINVQKAAPTITWANPANITPGTPLGPAQLDATASVPGTFVYTPAASFILNPGSGQTLSVTFTPNDAADYTSVNATAAINVTQAAPTITWANPADITYGTPLGATQLDATASVPGTFAYSPAASNVLNAGLGETLSVTFTPTDSIDYAIVDATATINVVQATPTITWSNPANIVYGTALSGTQLNATTSWTVGGVSGSVAGTFTYTPAAGKVLGAGNNLTLSVAFTPTDTADYTTAAATALINVLQATPTISWANPANIVYGTALSSAQLDATSSWSVGGVSASVAGTFTYTPAAGTVLGAGNNQTLSVAFAPTDTSDYTTASATATINVLGTSPTRVYVASGYASDAPGTVVTWTDGSTHTVGFDAFGTIQAGINAVAANGTVNVASGTYTQQLTIDQSLSLVGAGVSSTTIQAPAGLSGTEIEIASGVTVMISGLSLDGASSSTAVDVNGGDLSASNLAITGYNIGVSVEHAGSASITASTITSSTTGILVGSGLGDTSTLTATNDSLAGDTVGVQNNQASGQLTATMDWWGSSTGPNNPGNPGGTGERTIGSVNFSPWLGDTNIVAPDYLVLLSTTGEALTVTPNSGNTSLGVSLGGNSVGVIPGGGTLSFTGTGGTVTIDGQSGSGSTDVFTIKDTVVQFNAADALSGSTINFNGTSMTRYVDAQGTTNTFNVQGSGASGPSGSLVGNSGTNAFVFSPTGKYIGSIQGGGDTTLNYSAYSSAVNINLGNGTNGMATGVTGTVTGITALIGGSFNDTLNAGTVPNVALSGGLGTNTLSVTGTGDSVVESIASSYTLTSTKLTGTGAAFTDKLSGIKVASLTGVSATSNAFTVSGWTGSGSLAAPAGTGAVTDSASGSFTLTNALLTAPNTTLSLNGVTTATLTDTGNTHTFTTTGWRGSGTLKGSTETLVDSVSSSVVLTNTSLAVTSLPALTLSGFKTANLTDTAGGDTFTVSGWTKSGSLTDSAVIGDTVTASKSAGYTLANNSLSSTDGMSLGLSGVTSANLSATTASKTFTVSGWTGSGSLTDTAKGIVAASENGGFTLTNKSLTSTDGIAVSLSGITTANLTTTATSGRPSYLIDASAFTGVTNLTAGGTVNAILFGGSGKGSTLSATGSGDDVLIGGSSKDTLTDTGTGYNILIGGPGVDTITGNGNDILISGTTSYDSNTSANIAALDAILAEWSSNDSYSMRISKIMNGVGSGGTDALNSSTCQSDGVANTVSDGASGR